MQIPSKNLPPLDTLIAFEAAARLGSFTLAAKELSLTQAAISQRIRNLETALDTRLFDRSHRRVMLNETGRKYQHTVATALGHLAGATRNLRELPETEQLTIAADEAVAHLWLVPRLYEFSDKFPELSVRLIVSDQLEKCLVSEVDVAIVFGGEDTTGFEAARMFPEVVYPVCSPAFAQKLGKRPGLEEISQANLIELDDERWDWMNWEMWMTSAFGRSSTTQRQLKIGSYPLVIDAACAGRGVALGWGGLVDGLLEGGKLVKPSEVSVCTDNGYNILSNLHSPSRNGRDVFMAWIEREIP